MAEPGAIDPGSIRLYKKKWLSVKYINMTALNCPLLGYFLPLTYNFKTPTVLPECFTLFWR